MFIFKPVCMDVGRISRGWDNSGYPRPQRTPPADIPIIPADDSKTDREKENRPDDAARFA
jgi:hypothetical protein